MKQRYFATVVIWLFVVGGFVLQAGAASSETGKEELQLRLELNLVDGSRVIGIPRLETVPVQTSYAKLEVPLKKIRTMTVGEDHETAALDLQNGDRLKGAIHLEPIKLETAFGPVKINLEHVRELRVLLSGGARRRGLVLYYSFDDDENGKVRDGSGQGNDGYWVGEPMYEDGVKGRAARFRSKDTYIVSAAERLNMKGWTEATVSVRVSMMERTTYAHIINRGPLTTDQQGAFWLAVGRGYGKGSLGFQSGPATVLLERKPGGQADLELKRWYQLTMTYDGAKLRYYVDGQLEKETPANEPNTPIWDGAETKLVIGNMSRLPFINWTDMYFNGLVDEVYIFNRALAGDEVKDISEGQTRSEPPPGK